MDLGRVGVWSLNVHMASAAGLQAQVEEIEELGYSTLWCPEMFGAREPFALGGLVLSWTSRLVAATGIATIYARHAVTARNGARTLAGAHPGRFLLGLGASHELVVAAEGLEYGRPLPAMRAYLDAMDAAPWMSEAVDTPVVLGAVGPLLLDLARDRTQGAHPYLVTPEFIAGARERLGPDKLLAPEQTVVLEADPGRAREIARSHTGNYFGLENFRKHFYRLGFGDDDFVDGGSDRLVDALVAWGDVDAIATRVNAHLDAGADHVALQVLGSETGDLGMKTLRELAPALVAA